MSTRVVDLTGRVFGRLEVLERAHRGRTGKHYWRCRCSCGKESFVQGGNLKSGGVKSCGCVQYEGLKRWVTDGGEAREKQILKSRKYPTAEHSALVSKYRDYRVGAEKRGLVWGLTLDDLLDITSKPCVYCGAPPERRPGTKYKNSVDTYSSGIDRVDNSEGYLLANVVPCCSWCNRVKSDNSLEVFVGQCKAVADHFGWVINGR